MIWIKLASSNIDLIPILLETCAAILYCQAVLKLKVLSVGRHIVYFLAFQ